MDASICFFNSARGWGGGEKWHLDMASALHREGWPVLLAGNPGSALTERARRSGIPCLSVAVGNLSFLNPRKVGCLRSLFRQHKVRTVILNLPADLKLAGIAARRAAVPSIVYRRGSAIAVRDTFLNRYLFTRVVTGVIANSQETKRTILRNNPALFPADKIGVIYNGIQTAAFVSMPLPRSGEGGLTIGTLGRMVAQKAQHHLIDVSVKLARQGIAHATVIAGDGPLSARLKRYAEDRKVGATTLFPGFVEDPARFFAQIDIFVLTSAWEGFGYVLVEAMASGKPVIAYDVSSNAEIIDDGGSGFLVPFGDTDAIAGRIALLRDAPTRIRMGEHGRRRAVERFSIERARDELKRYLGLARC